MTHLTYAPLAQRIRASGYEPGGRGFESYRVCLTTWTGVRLTSRGSYPQQTRVRIPIGSLMTIRKEQTTVIYSFEFEDWSTPMVDIHRKIKDELGDSWWLVSTWSDGLGKKIYMEYTKYERP